MPIDRVTTGCRDAAGDLVKAKHEGNISSAIYKKTLRMLCGPFMQTSADAYDRAQMTYGVPYDEAI